MELKEKLVVDFEKDEEVILNGASGAIKDIRRHAFEQFRREGIPHTKMEDWRFTNISNYIKPKYIQVFKRPDKDVEFKDIFNCDVPKLDTILIEIVNGWYHSDKEHLQTLEDGLIIGSFAEGLKRFPELFEKHYKSAASETGNGLLDLNTATANDGVFIYVPDNVIVKKPIQIVNMIYSAKDLIINQRNLFVIGKNAQVKTIVCDHSMFFNSSFVNSFTQILAGDNSVVEYNKLQNYSNVTSQYTSTDIVQQAGSVVNANTITLHGGFTRNDVKVMLEGSHSEINLNGLYLMDRKQHVDNNTMIIHAVPECTSNEKYKGILDDESKGVFSGNILVKQDAQKTSAFQLNKNLLLTDTAQVNSKPNLVIYADDVKCSHGATVGQLDLEAMFYLRSRGISQTEARMLLMFAFAHEIIKEIKIEPLRERMDELVAKRLRGEMSRCNNCEIHCS